jgi:nucleotide-binding universal stress UspA family protein
LHHRTLEDAKMTTNDDTYRIVVGHDLESTGDAALEEATALAARIPGSELHVVHALSRPSRTNAGKNERRLDDAMTELRARVELAVARYRRVPAQVHVRFGSASDAIVQVAVDYDASLVLVGTHGRRGLDRVRSRSIAERLVRRAPLPVLVAHAKDFSGLPTTVRPDAARPGEPLHRERPLSDLPVAPMRTSHIAGLF